jgi:putative peptidoglycan lipid II flippase
MSFIKNTARVGLLTFVSRITGYIRDVLIASLLGASIWNDAFILALRLPNLFRNIFGEGAFNNAFVPIFAQKLKASPRQASIFAAKIHTILITALCIFCAVMLYNMRSIVLITTPGMSDDMELIKLITDLTQITFPYLIFISLAAFHGGVLNAQGKFAAFAMMPILFNLVLITACFMHVGGNVTTIRILAWAVLLAGFFELIFMIVFSYKSNSLIGFSVPSWGRDTRQLLRRFFPGVVGSGVMHINLWVDTMLASFVSNGISYLYYADRVNQLPLAIIGTALGTVLLPVLAKEVANNSFEKVINLQNQAIKFAMFIVLPAAIGLFSLAFEIIRLLFAHGNFDENAVLQTALSLQVMTMGLPAYVLTKIFLALFYANGDTRTPVINGLICIVSNVIFSLIFMPTMQHVGIALATIISAWINFIILFLISIARGWYKLSAAVLKYIIKYIFACIIMFIVIYFVRNLLTTDNELLLTSALIISGVVSYGIICLMIKAIPKKENEHAAI